MMNATKSQISMSPSIVSQAGTGIWIGFAGGMLYGLVEAWSILVQHATDPVSALVGLVAAAGFVVALDGLLGAVGLGILSTLVAWLGKGRLHRIAPDWAAFCVGLFVFSLLFVLGLDQFGVLSGAVAGARMILGVGAVFVVSLLVGAGAFYLARLGQLQGRFVQWGRGTLIVIWLAALVLPIAYAFLGS